MKRGQLVAAAQHLLKLGADLLPVRLEIPGPGKHRFVEYRRVTYQGLAGDNPAHGANQVLAAPQDDPAADLPNTIGEAHGGDAMYQR